MIRDRGNLFLAGVGGQGILLASEILAEAFLLAGYDVKKSEVHGMAQRGGAVTTHLRFGPRVRSPLIEPGTADMLMAFEAMEALRFLHFLAPDGIVLANTQEIMPPSVSTGREPYPGRIVERLREATRHVFMIDALAAALAMNEVRAVNTVLVGAASRFLPLSEEICREAMRSRLPEKVLEVNDRAFRAGRALLPPADARP